MGHRCIALAIGFSALLFSWNEPAKAEPTLEIKAARSTLESGEATTLTWSANTSQFRSCELVGKRKMSEAMNGSVSTGKLASSTTFILNCRARKGGQTHKTVTVRVHANAVFGQKYTDNLTKESYGPLSTQVVNICIPNGIPFATKLPAALIFHAGGWINGNEDSGNALCHQFARRGIIGVSVNYRLVQAQKPAPAENLFPAQLQDAQLAVRWLRENAARLQVDPQAICAVGASAGSYLAISLGVWRGIRAGDMAEQIPHRSPHVPCVIGYSNISDLRAANLARYTQHLVGYAPYVAENKLARSQVTMLEDFRRENSPVMKSGPRSADLLLIQGAKDDIAATEAQAIPLHLRAIRYGRNSQLYIRPGGHGLGTTGDPAILEEIFAQSAAFILNFQNKAAAKR